MTKERATRVSEIVDEEGNLIGYEYSDGSRRAPNGHMLTPLPGWAPISSTERSHELSARRVEVNARKRAEWELAAARGMLAGVKGISPEVVNNEPEAWGELNGKMAELAYAADGHASVRAFEAVGKAIGAMQQREAGAQVDTVNMLVVGAGAAKALAELGVLELEEE